jgi:protein gp37
MAYKTLIAWTDHTFNPWMGCHKVSDGCKHCYAETLVKNRMGRAGVWGANGVRQRTKGPWRKVRAWAKEAEAEQSVHRVFCASLADVFEDYPGPNEWRPDVWEIIRESPWLDFQLLTKRPENIARMLPDDWDTAFPGHDFYPNVWLGTSIEDNRVAGRGPILTSVPALVHFVSYEPAVGPLDELNLEGIEWMIVGGESGPGHRKLDLRWARSMRARCAESGTAFFFKQDSGPRTEMGIDALGEVIREYPTGWDRGVRGSNAQRHSEAARRLLPEDAFA